MSIGRNDPCPCGSGRKYKKCCLDSNAAELPVGSRPPAKSTRAAKGDELTFEDLAQITAPDELPFLEDNPSSGRPRQGAAASTLAAAQMFFENEPECTFEVQSDERRQIAVDMEFSLCNTRRGYGQVVKLSVHEKGAEGGLAIQVREYGRSVPVARHALIVNAGLFALWVALNPRLKGQPLPFNFEELRRELTSVLQARQKILAAEATARETLADVRLSGLILLMDNSSFGGTPLPMELPDHLPAKLKHVERLEMSPTSRVEDRYSLLSECVWYLFSDGGMVSAADLKATVYKTLVPPDLSLANVGKTPKALWKKTFQTVTVPEDLAPDLDPKLLLIGKNTSYLSYNSWNFDGFGEVGSVRGLLRAALFRHSRSELGLTLLFAAKGTPAKHLVREGAPCLELQQVRLNSPPLALDLQFGATPLSAGHILKAITSTFKLSSPFAEPCLGLSYGWLNLKDRTLSFAPLTDKYHAAQFLAMSRPPARESDPLDTWVQMETAVAPDFALRLSTRGLDSTRAVAEHFAEQMPAPLRLQSKAALVFAADGRWTLLRKLSHLDEPASAPLVDSYVVGFSRATLYLMEILRHGICLFFDTEAREMATAAKKSREFELKLLKHQGVTNLLMFESLHARFRRQLSDGFKVTSPHEILEHLESKILALMGFSGSEALRPLKTYCTSTLYNKLKNFIEHVYSYAPASGATVFLSEGPVWIEDFLSAEWRCLLRLLEGAAVSSRGALFSKRRFNFIGQMLPEGVESLKGYHPLLASEVPSFHESIGAPLAPSPLLRHPYAGTLAEAFAAFEPLLNEGFEFYRGNSPIAELGEDAFKIEFNLQDAKSADANSAAVPLRQQSLNWFDLHPKFFFQGREIAATEARDFIKSGLIEYQGAYFLIPSRRLPSLQKLAGFWDRLQRGKTSRARTSESPVYEVPKCQVLEMLALRHSGVRVIGGERWKSVCAFYDQLGQSDGEALVGPRPAAGQGFVPDSVRATLKPYQVAGVRRLYEMYRLGLGSVLADDMGLGKTLQALTFLEKLRHAGQLGHCLIVVPTSLTYNWLTEAERFVPDLPMIPFSVKDFERQRAGAQGVWLTTYGMLQEHREVLANCEWNVVLFDEAQNLKNLVAQRTGAARALNAQVKIALTGTPLENHFGELYSLIDLVVPGALGTREDFYKIYVNPTAVSRDEIDYLKLKLKPLLLRRTKAEIMSELPEKQESLVSLPFESKQKVIYRDIAIAYNEKVQQTIATEGEAKSQLQMLTALLRLRQACSDPQSLPGVRYSGVPPKIEALVEALEEIIESKCSALVFTQFLQTMERTESLLKKANLPVFTLHGGLNRRQREQALDQFENVEGGAILLMTLKTGGVGLNLTKASYVFHLEPWWNPAVENQATDRAHRMGQKSAVQVYRYIMHESVEEKIEKLKHQKRLRFDAMFASQEPGEDSEATPAAALGSAHLSQKDFEFLLS